MPDRALHAGFTTDLRAATSGQAFPQSVFDHWGASSVQLPCCRNCVWASPSASWQRCGPGHDACHAAAETMSQDPMVAGNQAATIVADIRKRKGLKDTISPLSEYEDKL